ncbi:MAG: hypothetical protein HPY75_09885 [Actinobacteria bacterium]|nr:hypothetical protein [Actinomycetota bacterium]
MGNAIVAITVSYISAALGFFLAFSIYRAKPKGFLNRSLAAAFFLFSLWMICPTPSRIVADPSPLLVTWIYRVSYFLITLAGGLFLIFCLAFLKGGHPGRRWLRFLLPSIAALSLLNLTPWILTQATCANGVYRQTNGPLHPLSIATTCVLGASSLWLIHLKRRRSPGIDRARATYILIGFGVFIPLGVLLAGVLPALMSPDVTTDWIYPLTLIPIGFTAYAILRHRLLDVRMAVRQTFSYLLTLALFGVPLVAIYALTSAWWNNDAELNLAISVSTLIIAVAFTPMALRWASRLASRLFFSGLYDAVELLHEASVAITSRKDIRDGVVVCLVMACGRLGLKELTAVVPAAVTGKGVNWIMGSGERGGETFGFRREDDERSRLYRLRDRIVLAEDWDTVVETAEETLLSEMRERGLVALVPLRGPGGTQGTLLVGEKLNRFSLDPMDLDFLDQLAARIGLFIENHLLSLHLMDRVEELSEAKRMLEESDRFKSEVISITSHEFRIPLSVINGFAIILRNYFPRLSQEERDEILDHIVSSCHRLDSLLEKFLTVSSLRDGKVAVEMSPCSVEAAFNEACSTLPGDARRRVRVVLRGNGMQAETDPYCLGLILKNLLDNARRFSDDLSPITLLAEEREDHIEVEVRDEGEGIEPELSEVIFDPFTRLEEMDKHGEGIGLGLYIVRLAADLIGARVTVESSPGRGAAFRFTLPKAQGS